MTACWRHPPRNNYNAPCKYHTLKSIKNHLMHLTCALDKNQGKSYDTFDFFHLSFESGRR